MINQQLSLEVCLPTSSRVNAFLVSSDSLMVKTYLEMLWSSVVGEGKSPLPPLRQTKNAQCVIEAR
jgi:hypothetical protein